MPIIEALASVGVTATLTGRNDLAIDGRKFSGNAQHESGGRVLHHGTLLFNSDLDALSSVLTVDAEKIQSKGVKSTRSRVTNLAPFLPHGWEVNDFITLIADFVKTTFSPEEKEAPTGALVDALYRKYASQEWIYPTSGIAAAHTLRKKRRYPFGTVELLLDIKGETVREAKIVGDFFGFSDIRELEEALVEARLEDVHERLAAFDIGRYISGMTREELEELILSN